VQKSVNNGQKSFIKLAPDVNDSKLFSSLLMLRQNKLERSSLASFFRESLVHLKSYYFPMNKYLFDK
jgi:hypothetical protein